MRPCEEEAINAKWRHCTVSNSQTLGNSYQSLQTMLVIEVVVIAIANNSVPDRNGGSGSANAGGMVVVVIVLVPRSNSSSYSSVW